MALISIIEDFKPKNDARLLNRAESLKPVLYHRIAEPVSCFILKERYSYEKDSVVLQDLKQMSFGKGQNLCLDFGKHLVGRVRMNLSYSGSHPDAPVFLKLKFAETVEELSENFAEYDGWISSGWMQEEYIHVDDLPEFISLPRRFAFRYLKITILDTSRKYKLNVRQVECVTETSADLNSLKEENIQDERLKSIYDVSIRTLANCMQDVFEDGPKRDRRLWIGDLRIQALVNYVSFRNNDLVKRCLYLFAGSTFEDDRVSAAIFTGKNVEADDTWLSDYSLMFPVILEEYLEETSDVEALNDLYDTAKRQVELALLMCDDNGIVSDKLAKNAFIDWTENLDKKAAMQGVLIYSLNYGIALAEIKGDKTFADKLRLVSEKMKISAREEFYDENNKVFISDGQVSTASQVWSVLAGILSDEENKELMEKAEKINDEYKMMTPYMHHYYLEALIKAGLKDKALTHITEYWGSMIDNGADTFYEAWDPDNPDVSPYGSNVINSYCHAWSCSPAYILKKYYGGK